MIWPDGIELGEAPRRVPNTQISTVWPFYRRHWLGILVGTAVGGLAIGSDIVTTVLLSDGGKTADGVVIGFEEANEVNGETVMGFDTDLSGWHPIRRSILRLMTFSIDEKILVEHVRSTPHRSRIIGMDAGLSCYG